MPHDDMTADDVLDLIDAHLPAATQVRKTSESELGFVFYDARDSRILRRLWARKLGVPHRTGR